jgi:hypothetical protein
MSCLNPLTFSQTNTDGLQQPAVPRPSGLFRFVPLSRYSSKTHQWTRGDQSFFVQTAAIVIEYFRHPQPDALDTVIARSFYGVLCDEERA